jgi:4-hydroxy-tetrahydrodipicolinate reductase
LGVVITDNIEHACEAADAVLDFTSPSGTKEFLRLTTARYLIHVIGTTGFSEADFALLKEAGQKTTLVCSGNMSIGANLLGGLARLAARSLGSDFDIRIVDMHHRHKMDSPSGTALLLKSDIEEAVQGRDMPITSLRCGTVVGEHTVLFAGPQERIALVHTAEQRSIFASGAIRAALWAYGQSRQEQTHGFFTMSDVLGLRDM